MRSNVSDRSSTRRTRAGVGPSAGLRPRAGLTTAFGGAFMFALCLLAASVSAQPRRATYANPVAPGDFPDPTVIRVGRDYWATATTSEWGPEYPILHSRDLVNWEAVGVVFRRRPDWAGGSFWAPELVHDRGRIFLYYTARKKGGPLCVAVATAPGPRGPYTDRGPLVCQEVG